MTKLQLIKTFPSKVSAFIKNNNEKVVTLAAPAAIVGGVMAAQTAIEVKHAKDKIDKKNAIINNIIISTTMISAGIAGFIGMGKLLKRPGAINLGKKITDKLPGFVNKGLKKYPVEEFFKSLSIPLGSGIAGGLTGALIQNKFPVKENKKIEELEEAGYFKMGHNILNKDFSINPIGLLEPLDGVFSTKVGYSVGRQKGFKNKAKMFMNEVLGASVVHVALLVPMLKIIEDKYEHNKFKKYPLILIAGLGASMVGKQFGHFLNKQVTEKVVEHQVWEDISAKQKQLLKKSVFTHNIDKKKQMLKEVEKLEAVKKKMKVQENKKDQAFDSKEVVESVKKDASSPPPEKEKMKVQENKKDQAFGSKEVVDSVKKDSSPLPPEKEEVKKVNVDEVNKPEQKQQQSERLKPEEKVRETKKAENVKDKDKVREKVDIKV